MSERPSRVRKIFLKRSDQNATAEREREKKRDREREKQRDKQTGRASAYSMRDKGQRG